MANMRDDLRAIGLSGDSTIAELLETIYNKGRTILRFETDFGRVTVNIESGTPDDGPVVEGVALIITSPEVHAAQVDAARNLLVTNPENRTEEMARILWPDIWYDQGSREVRVIINGETITVEQNR